MTTTSPTITATDDDLLALFAEHEIDPDTFDGYDGLDTHWEIQQVASALSDRYGLAASTALSTAFTFGMDANADGEIGGCTVGIYLPGGMHLTRWQDIKQVTGYEATGVDAALTIARNLIDTYNTVATYANAHGLLDR